MLINNLCHDLKISKRGEEVLFCTEEIDFLSLFNDTWAFLLDIADWLNGTLRIERNIVEQSVDDVKTQDSRRALTVANVACYPHSVPIRFAIMCEQCERIYLLAHPDRAKWILFTPGSAPHPPFRLACICRAKRHFDGPQAFPYRVSEYTCQRGYAERDEYEAIPPAKIPKARRGSQ